MSIRRKLKRTTIQYIIVITICTIVIGGAAAITSILITEQIKERYTILLTQARHEMDANKQTVYTAVEDITVGEYITADNVKIQTVYAAQPEEVYMTAEDIGKITLIDVTAGTQLLKEMLTENNVSSELRELDYSVISIGSNISDNDIVDIRISYPNGEDYDVLSKKALKGYSGDLARCFLWLTEEEIIRLHNAIVDAYLYSGAYLYTTKYIEPNLQEATIVTYTPSIQAIELIKKNPNIIEEASSYLNINVRKALENRLAESLNKDISSQWGDIDSNYIYQDYPSTQKEDKEYTMPEGTTVGDSAVTTENHTKATTEGITENIMEDTTEGTVGKTTDTPSENRNNVDVDQVETSPDTGAGTGSADSDGADLGSRGNEDDDKEDETDYFMFKEG